MGLVFNKIVVAPRRDILSEHSADGFSDIGSGDSLNLCIMHQDRLNQREGGQHPQQGGPTVRTCRNHETRLENGPVEAAGADGCPG